MIYYTSEPRATKDLRYNNQLGLLMCRPAFITMVEKVWDRGFESIPVEQYLLLLETISNQNHNYVGYKYFVWWY